MLQWTPEGTVITLLVPSDRGPEPARNPIPTGPLTRRTREEPTSTRTFPNLLEDPHDEDLFEYYTRSQITELRPGRLAPSPGRTGHVRVHLPESRTDSTSWRPGSSVPSATSPATVVSPGPQWSWTETDLKSPNSTTGPSTRVVVSAEAMAAVGPGLSPGSLTGRGWAIC